MVKKGGNAYGGLLPISLQNVENVPCKAKQGILSNYYEQFNSTNYTIILNPLNLPVETMD